MTTFAVLRHAAIAGFQDFRAMYSWKTWCTGWLLRVVMQVIFYSLLGRLIGSGGKCAIRSRRRGQHGAHRRRPSTDRKMGSTMRDIGTATQLVTGGASVVVARHNWND